jgi:tRNA/tmRNA/rRNA uracil-C5-methylase (TrmA/RlmC/RlmD family)
VIAVETDAGASADARRNLRDLPWVEVVHGRVDQTLAGARPDRRHGRRPPPAKGRRVEGPVDLVVLDPPRSGAGAAVVTAIAGRRPRAVAYVACDPAALARDVHTFAAAGYTLTGLRGFDAFPMTHHVECVALFTP